jgi:hypothetical protein
MTPIRYKDIPVTPESAYASDIAKIVNSVEQTVKASYEKEKQGRAVRFAHAKSYGIVRASVEIESGLAPEYAQGIYAIPATYEAVIRFSNGLGHLGPDVFGMRSRCPPQGTRPGLFPLGPSLKKKDGRPLDAFIEERMKKMHTAIRIGVLCVIRLMASTSLCLTTK